MVIKIAQSIRKFIFSYDWEIVEIQGAVAKIAWGFWLLLPFQTFRAISGYNAVGTENIWGTGLLIYGLLHFLAIVSGRRTLRKYFTFGAFLFWLFTILLIAQQSLTAGILPLFAVIAFFMGMNFIRLSTVVSLDRRSQDEGRPEGLPERREDSHE